MLETTTDPPRTLDDVPGWFKPLDQALFGWFLERQQQEQPGDLVELGAYLGKSAILMGRYLRPGERFTVCDLFGLPAVDSRNQLESDYSYRNLERGRFEANYLAFHPELPVVVQAPTAAILDHVGDASGRFVHIDASHLYEHVAHDIDAARKILRPGGVAVFDDFRAEHTPGTAAAVWEAVFTKGLRPVCLTANKLYGTWDDPTPLQDELAGWLADYPLMGTDRQMIAGQPVLRVFMRKANKPKQPDSPRLRRLAADLIPPAVAKIIRQRQRST